MRLTVLMGRLLFIPWIVFAVLIVQCAWWAMDREEPFRVLAVEPAAAQPGTVVSIVARVRRDAGRDCSAVFSRYIYDGANFRHDLEGSQTMTADAIRDLDRRTPGELRISVMVPPTAARGQAALFTVLNYRCNPVHTLWPISVESELPFQII